MIYPVCKQHGRAHRLEELHERLPDAEWDHLREYFTENGVWIETHGNKDRPPIWVRVVPDQIDVETARREERDEIALRIFVELAALPLGREPDPPCWNLCAPWAYSAADAFLAERERQRAVKP